MYYVGQKIICIDPTWGGPNGRGISGGPQCPNLPTKGSVYTVRGIEKFVAVRSEGPAWFLRLNEIVNPPNASLMGPVEPMFMAIKYIPFEEKQTDIGFAHEILRALTQPVRENA